MKILSLPRFLAFSSTKSSKRFLKESIIYLNMFTRSITLPDLQKMILENNLFHSELPSKNNFCCSYAACFYYKNQAYPVIR